MLYVWDISDIPCYIRYSGMFFFSQLIFNLNSIDFRMILFVLVESRVFLKKKVKIKVFFNYILRYAIQ